MLQDIGQLIARNLVINTLGVMFHPLILIMNHTMNLTNIATKNLRGTSITLQVLDNYVSNWENFLNSKILEKKINKVLNST